MKRVKVKDLRHGDICRAADVASGFWIYTKDAVSKEYYLPCFGVHPSMDLTMMNRNGFETREEVFVYGNLSDLLYKYEISKHKRP